MRLVKGQKILSVVTVAASVSFVGMMAAGTAVAQSVPPVVAPEPVEGIGGGESSQPSKPTPGAPVIREILVEGTQRIEQSTVLSYINMQPGDPLVASNVNKALKTLFSTGLFADVSIEQRGLDLVVKVVENPIINRIAFEGNKRLKDEILETEVQLRPRVVYTRTRVQNDVKRLLEVYRRSGRFATRIEPKIIQLPQNRVDLAFEIEEGPATGVHKISFIGNRFSSDSALKDEIITKESRWYRFFDNSDTYDPDKLTFDRELLRRYYLASGFADFRVDSAVAELSEDRTGFFITYTLQEGERYSLGKFDVVSKIRGVEAEPLREIVELEEGDWYNADLIDDTVLKLTDAAGDQGYAFVEVRPIIDRDRENKVINVTFELNDGPKVYVERIEIRGNVRTLDKVVRREFLLVEGDAFNSAKLRRSKERIRDLGFFKAVEVNNLPGSAPDSTIVEVDIEEQSTGELSVGAGVSSSAGLLGEISLRERNFLGKGQDLYLATSIGTSKTAFDVRFTEPYFLDKQLAATVAAFHKQIDNQDSTSSDLKQTGMELRLGYNITPVWRQSVRYRLEEQEIEDVDSNASTFIRAAENRKDIISSVGQTIAYDTRNSRIDPTDGFIVSMDNDYAGVGGDIYKLDTILSGSYYYSFSKEWVLKTSATAGYRVNIDDPYMVPGLGITMRGFETNGVGPRDRSTSDFLGGNTTAVGTVELRFPLGLPDEFGISGSVYTDVGTVYDFEQTDSTVDDDASIRNSIGFGVNWKSPFGPIRVDLAQALLKEDYDKTEFFSFNFGTRF
ncbi:outer membrane protein assembly factor BamA [Aestuariispira insulae]|uniref:outer membrane protein assembly factor BamA n=1 Tax=Aestuariispira insulae TaxID=1461337 RepID=UPI001FEACEF5|nr:outer membrane protein assembly factor BamA [Aestuariispira insulae]